MYIYCYFNPPYLGVNKIWKIVISFPSSIGAELVDSTFLFFYYLFDTFLKVGLS